MSIPVGRKSTAGSTSTLKVGDPAPDFDLGTHTGANERWRLSEHRGQNVVVAFYPFAFTPV